MSISSKEAPFNWSKGFMSVLNPIKYEARGLSKFDARYNVKIYTHTFLIIKRQHIYLCCRFIMVIHHILHNIYLDKIFLFYQL